MDVRFVLAPDDNGTVLVSFPDFPEAHTFGVDSEEARARALDAFETVIDAYMKARRPIPASRSARRGQVTMRVPALVAAKIDLYRAMLDAKLTKYALA